MHNRSLAHRDLKPENILLCGPDHDQPVVIDMETMVDNHAWVDDGVSRVGTPAWMPDLSRGQEDTPCGQDVYALLAIMAYTLTNVRGDALMYRPASTTAGYIQWNLVLERESCALSLIFSIRRAYILRGTGN